MIHAHDYRNTAEQTKNPNNPAQRPAEKPADCPQINGSHSLAPPCGDAAALALLGAVPYVQRPDLSFAFLAPHFEKTFGIDPAPLRESTSAFFSLLKPSKRESLRESFANICREGHSHALTYSLHPPDGNRVIYIRDARTPVFADNGDFIGYRGIFQDITRQQIAEKHLARTAWKEHLAVVTSGLIHDFNNIMAGIHSLAELYHDNLGPEHHMAEGIGHIKSNAFHAQKLCRRIVELNREAQAGPSYHNVESLLDEQIDLIRAALPKATRIATNFTGSEIPVYIDDTLFRQVILNLAINAREVLPKHGCVTIGVKRIEPGQYALAPTSSAFLTENAGVEITFGDNGGGIPNDILPRIFDPFFTTKESAKGSGFGLYNARLFFEKHRGAIDVHTVAGEGTTFHMFLPLATFEENREPEDDEHESTCSRRPSLLLYSCIDPESLQLTSLMRQRHWEVITFTSAEAANSYLAESILPPHLALAVDIGYDDNAARLLKAISQIHPNIQTALHVIGRNPDTLPETLRRQVDLLLKDEIPDTQIVQRLAEILPV